VIPALAVAAALAAPPAATQGVLHRGTVQGDVVQWRSTWRAGERCVELAAPFEPPTPYTVERREGRPYLCRPDDHGWSLHYETPFPSDTLGLPLLADTLQRVDVEGASFESHDGAVTKHLRVWSTPGIPRRERKDLDATLPQRRASTQIYLAPRRGQPVHGSLRPLGASSGVVYGALGVFAAIGAALALGYRLLEQGARRERVNRWLEEEGLPVDEL
jgi:hypothetical protein